MAKPGPAPQPTALKRLHGNPGKRPLNEREPQPAQKLPLCPRHLKGVARAQWTKVGKMLLRLRVMTEADAVALELYCESYASYREALIQVEKYQVAMVRRLRDKDGDFIEVRRNPFSTEVHRYKAEVMSFLREFGMTPSSRSSLVVGESDDNPLTKYGIVG